MVHIHIFRKDLRIKDNYGLFYNYYRLKNNEIIYLFIFVKEQISRDLNPYFNDRVVQFMIESLEELAPLINLNFILVDSNEDIPLVLQEIHNKYHIDLVTFNLDYSPYAIKRDQKTIQWCEKNQVECKYFHDLCIKPKYYFGSDESLKYINKDIKDPEKKMYVKFVYYFKTFDIDKTFNYKNVDVNKGLKINLKGFSTNTEYIRKTYLKEQNNNWVYGGRKNAIKLIKQFKDLNYSEIKNDLSKETSNLSAYIRFGCVSVREVWNNIKDLEYRRQLIWRDFYNHLLLNFGYQMLMKYVENGKIVYISDSFNVLKDYKPSKENERLTTEQKIAFEKWKSGNTGALLVDAGMRQMLKTGYMHNRARLVVADFLVKVLKIDWTLGEKWFANNLIDYEVANNTGNWLWITGAIWSSQYKFRTMNPERQREKYDPEGIYIKRWLSN